MPRTGVAVLVLWAFAGIAAAAGLERPSVHFAGVAFTGDAVRAESMLPHVHASIAQHGMLALNRRIEDALVRRAPSRFGVESTDRLATLDSTGNPVVMAVAIDRETLVSERIAGQHKLLFELAAQALFFDFRERQVLYSYPITLQYIELYGQEPTSEQKQAVADRLLFGADDSSLPAAVASELHALSLPAASSRRIQLVDVRLADGLAARMPEHQRDIGLIGHEFSKLLASNLHLPLLPHSVGEAISGTMTARFAEGDSYTLTIPKPDYGITLEVSDFREKTLRETPAFRQQLYGAFFSLRVEEPLSATVYFDQPLRQGATRTIPASQEQVDAWAAYYETLLAGFVSFAQATGGQDLAWSGEQTGGREFTKQLKTLRELIVKCR